MKLLHESSTERVYSNKPMTGSMHDENNILVIPKDTESSPYIKTTMGTSTHVIVYISLATAHDIMHNIDTRVIAETKG